MLTLVVKERIADSAWIHRKSPYPCAAIHRQRTWPKSHNSHHRCTVRKQLLPCSQNRAQKKQRITAFPGPTAQEEGKIIHSAPANSLTVHWSELP